MRIMVNMPVPAGHAAEVGGFGKGDMTVLHLDPDGLVAEMGADLKKDRIVKIDGRAQEGFAAVSREQACCKRFIESLLIATALNGGNACERQASPTECYV
jgi:hypothetical protein